MKTGILAGLLSIVLDRRTETKRNKNTKKQRHLDPFVREK